MKLRIRGNSLRLRLTRAEVDAVARDGRVEEAIAFGARPADRLTYAVVAGEAASVSAEWSGGAITVTLPAALAREWASSERVGIEHDQAIGGGEGAMLRVSVEKDFACLTPREGEDDGDAFPNPNASC